MASFYRDLIRRSALLGAAAFCLALSGCSGCSTNTVGNTTVTPPASDTPATPDETPPPPPLPLNLIAENYGTGSGRPPLQKDGKLVRLSFLTPVEGRNKLFSVDLTGNPDSLRVLVTDPALAIIEHEWDESGHAIFVADKFVGTNKIRGLYVYDSGAGTVKELTEGLFFCPYDENDTHFTFQIAGGVVAFMAARSGPEAPCDTDRNFFVAANSGQNLREISNRLVEVPGPKPLSPDGSSIGFAASDGHDIEIFVVDIATQVHTQLTKNNYDEIEFPIACNDGRWAFPAFDGTNFEVNLFDEAKSPQIAPLTSGDTNFFNLYWNPNCTKLAFQGIKTGTGFSEIYIHSFADNKLTQVTDNGTDEDLLSDPWNPGFDLLAFSIPVGDIQQLGMTHLDGTPEQWTAHEASLGQAVWAPGGDKVLYSTVNVAGNTQIWVRNIKEAWHFPLGPARANGIALNFACGDQNFAILRDSDGHDTDIWVVDLASGSRLNITSNAMEDFDPQCGLLPGDPVQQPLAALTTTGATRNLCDLITCDPGTACQPLTGACVGENTPITNCNFPEVDCPADTHCSLATSGTTEGTCIPDGFCDSNDEGGENGCEEGQTCNASHLCEGPPPPNHDPKLKIVETRNRFGVVDDRNPVFTVDEGVEMTIFFKVSDDRDPGDTLTLSAESEFAALPECGTAMSSCLSQIPADATGTPEGANWKFVWHVSHDHVNGAQKTMQLIFAAHDNRGGASDPKVFTFIIKDKPEPAPVVISIALGGQTINDDEPFGIDDTRTFTFDVTATADSRPTPIEVTSPGSFVQVTDGTNTLAKRLDVTAPCGPPGNYIIQFSSQDPDTGALGVARLRLDFKRRTNRVPTTRLIYPNPDIFTTITLKPLTVFKALDPLDPFNVGLDLGGKYAGAIPGKYYLPKELIRAPGTVDLYFVASTHEAEDYLSISETVTTFNPSESSTARPPDFSITDATLTDYPAFDAASCTFNKVRKVSFTAGPEGPGKVQISFATSDGAAGAGHIVTNVASLELGHIWVNETVAGGALKLAERDYVVTKAGEQIALNISAVILGSSNLVLGAKTMAEGTLKKVSGGGHIFTWNVPQATNFQPMGAQCSVVPLTLLATQNKITIQRTVRLIVAGETTEAQDIAKCIAGMP